MSRIAGCGLLAAFALVSLVGLSGTARAELIYGATINDFLVSFDSTHPENVAPGVSISGLEAGEHVISMDVQPGTNSLYGLGSNGRLYSLDPTSGQATFLGHDFGFALSGANGGMTFNRADGHLRLVSSSDHNMIIDALRAQTMTVGKAISYPHGDQGFGMDPNVTQIGSTADGHLYGIDTGMDTLVNFGSLESGDIHTVGQLGVDATEAGGFAISSDSGLSYAAFRQPGSNSTNFFVINLETGEAQSLGGVDTGGPVTSIAVAPEPASAMLVALGAVALSLRRMKR